MELLISLTLLAISSFLQNMAFTWVSRSRNSGDVAYHIRAAICSNLLWFVTNMLIVRHVWDLINTGDWCAFVTAGVVYIVSTALGSAFMMKRLLKTETGKRKVGAY